MSPCASATTNLGQFDMPFYMGGDSADSAGIDFEHGTLGWGTSIKDGDGDPDQYLAPSSSTLAGTGFPCFAVRLVRATAIATSFLDGAPVEVQDASTLSAFSGGDTLRFGGNGANNFPFRGVLDEVRIYMRALSDAEIATLHAP